MDDILEQMSHFAERLSQQRSSLNSKLHVHIHIHFSTVDIHIEALRISLALS